ncbi:MAG: hypothetical protein FD166_122 [Bacteroidetes bacterium]|nr:MAG: hypothetical protein FD166_122 [Bacteroidota bacterium]
MLQIVSKTPGMANPAFIDKGTRNGKMGRGMKYLLLWTWGQGEWETRWLSDLPLITWLLNSMLQIVSKTPGMGNPAFIDKGDGGRENGTGDEIPASLDQGTRRMGDKEIGNSCFLTSDFRL